MLRKLYGFAEVDIEDSAYLDFKSHSSDLEGSLAKNLFSDFREPIIQFSDPRSISVSPGEGTHFISQLKASERKEERKPIVGRAYRHSTWNRLSVG